MGLDVPGWYPLLLLGLGVFRLCRLAGWDDLTIPLRRRLTGLGDEEHSQWAHVIETFQEHGRDIFAAPQTVGDWFDIGNPEMPPLVREYGLRYPSGVGPDQPDHVYFAVPVTRRRWYLSKLVRCPWCLGFWVSLIAWIAYQAAPEGTLVLASLLALSALPGLITKNLDG